MERNITVLSLMMYGQLLDNMIKLNGEIVKCQKCDKQAVIVKNAGKTTIDKHFTAAYARCEKHDDEK